MLSKSDYMLFLRHPAWLWLKKHDKSKLPIVDDNTQAVFDAGHLFEKYAEELFAGIVTIGFTDFDEYTSMPDRTKTALDNGVNTIAQGRFESENMTCISDILVKNSDNSVDLYEVKSSTRVKSDHEYDLAFQMVVLEACGYDVNKVSVIHVNSNFVRNGEINAKEITSTSDVTDKVKAKREETKVYIKKAFEVIASPVIPDISPSLARGDAFKEWLGIYRNIATVDPESIYDLCSINPEKIGKLENLNIKRLVDIHGSIPLTEKQRLQVLATKNNKEIINKNEIMQFLKTLEFPLYFLDYETLGSIVPHFDGLSPYQQLPFQYSLHVLNEPGGIISHYMYLHKDNSNPSRVISESLKANIGTKGTILVWNESFEKECNTTIGNILPEYGSFYLGINERIKDLMIPFSSQWYVHKEFSGSASIKKVLPVLVSELSYKELGIHEGESAQRLWMEAVLDGKRDGEKNKILQDLEEYCKLDTLAMVEIYKQLLRI